MAKDKLYGTGKAQGRAFAVWYNGSPEHEREYKKLLEFKKAKVNKVDLK